MIKFSNGQIADALSVVKSDGEWDGSVRNIAIITLTGLDVAQAVTLFAEGAVWSVVDEDGSEDKSWNTYTKAGTITDNRDGTLIVKMGERNAPEDTISEMLYIVTGMEVTDFAEAVVIRTQIEDVCASAPDDVAAKVPSLSKPWAAGETVKEGDRRYYEPTGLLYKVRPGKGHTTQGNWTPNKTPDLWVVIDSQHAGTLDDPIFAARGMEYIYGKYYLDPEDNKVYLCKREGAEDGQTIVLHYLPHELINQYFVLAE